MPTQQAGSKPVYFQEEAVRSKAASVYRRPAHEGKPHISGVEGEETGSAVAEDEIPKPAKQRGAGEAGTLLLGEAALRTVSLDFVPCCRH